jgi:hypothetical protein
LLRDFVFFIHRSELRGENLLETQEIAPLLLNRTNGLSLSPEQNSIHQCDSNGIHEYHDNCVRNYGWPVRSVTINAKISLQDMLPGIE